jgi:hypothetical protein
MLKVLEMAEPPALRVLLVLPAHKVPPELMVQMEHLDPLDLLVRPALRVRKAQPAPKAFKVLLVREVV